MANLSDSDKLLSAEQQNQIASYKDQWAKANAAGDRAAMDAAHKAAEAIRNSAGYSGGADGSRKNAIAASSGGQTADQVAQWVEDYDNSNMAYGADGLKRYANGYSVAMNLRSQANYIRQQMEANSNAWSAADAATRQYLHDQNVQLAEILRKATGGARSEFNEKTGQWETANANLGYGVNTGAYNDLDWYRNFYGMTDDQINAYRNDTSRYRNFVDQDLIRNWVDESSGYTGSYAQFYNGPYAMLLGTPQDWAGAPWVDTMGDGFMDGNEYRAPVNADGSLGKRGPYYKNNNALTNYTRQFTNYVDDNGIIQPGTLNGGSGAWSSGATAANDYRYQYSPDMAEPNWWNENVWRQLDPDDEDDRLLASTPLTPVDSYGVPDAPVSQEAADRRAAADAFGARYATLPVPTTGASFGDRYAASPSLSANGSFSGTTGGGVSDLESYINFIYATNMASQLAQLKAAYEQNLAELDSTREKTDASFTEQKRQTTGDAAQEAANWREIANAQGLSSGALGQAALVQGNQLQSNLNALGAAQAQAQADLDQKRALLGQTYQLQILEAQANNDFERANALYQEAVRQDEALRQQAQFNAEMQLQYSKMAQDQLGGLLSGGSGGSDTVLGYQDALRLLDENPVPAPVEEDDDVSDLVKSMVDSIKNYPGQMSDLTKTALFANRQDLSDADLEWAFQQLGLNLQ